MNAPAYRPAHGGYPGRTRTVRLDYYPPSPDRVVARLRSIADIVSDALVARSLADQTVVSICVAFDVRDGTTLWGFPVHHDPTLRPGTFRLIP